VNGLIYYLLGFPAVFKVFTSRSTCFRQHIKSTYTGELSGLDPENCLNSLSSISKISHFGYVTSKLDTMIKIKLSFCNSY